MKALGSRLIFTYATNAVMQHCVLPAKLPEHTRKVLEYYVSKVNSAVVGLTNVPETQRQVSA